MHREFMSLPGEISSARAREKSAKTVVALMPRESTVERRVEEPTGWRKRLEKEPRGTRREEGAATAATTSLHDSEVKRCSRLSP